MTERQPKEPGWLMTIVGALAFVALIVRGVAAVIAASARKR